MKILMALWTASLMSYTLSEQCQSPSSVPTIDWSKMNKTWFDVLSTPAPSELADCYNWGNFAVVADGFTVTIAVKTEGSSETYYFPSHSILQSNTLYKIDRKYDAEFITAVSKSVAHKGDTDAMTAIEQLAANVGSTEVAYYTDYDNYFIRAMCTPGGWRVLVNMLKPRPTEEEIKDVQQFLDGMGISTEVKLKEACVSLNGA